MFQELRLHLWLTPLKVKDLSIKYKKKFNSDFGAPGEIRTPDLVVRSHTLYPAELRAHSNNIIENKLLSVS